MADSNQSDRADTKVGTGAPGGATGGVPNLLSSTGRYKRKYTVRLTLQRGVTGTARIANTSPVVECRAVPACCTVLLIRLYLDNIGRKFNRTASCVFVKELALLWSG